MSEATAMVIPAAAAWFEQLSLQIAVYTSVVFSVVIGLVGLLRYSSAALKHLFVVTAQVISLGVPLLWLTLPNIELLPGRSSTAEVADQKSVLSQWTDPANLNMRAILSAVPNGENGTSPASADVTIDDTSYWPPHAESPKSNAYFAGAKDIRSSGQQTARDSVAADLSKFMVCIWVVGTIVLLVRLIASGVRLDLLARSQPKSIPVHVEEAFENLLREFALRSGCRLLVSGHAKMPMTWGLFRSVIVIPTSVAEGPPDVVRSVLTHELAHVCRRDAHSRLIGQLSVATHWFNPLAWLAMRRSELLAEEASDDRVLQHGIVPADYAEHLLSVVRLLTTARNEELAVAMSKTSYLRQRVEAVLDERKSRRLPGQMLFAVSAVVAFAMALPITAQPPQTKPQASATSEAEVVSVDAGGQTRTQTETAGNTTTKGDFQESAAWRARRITGYELIRGRVVDQNGEPVSGVDVGRRWDAFQGAMSPRAWVITDSEGRFEIPLTSRRAQTVLVAMDKERKDGGLAIIEAQADSPSTSDVQSRQLSSRGDIEVEIQLEPLIEVRGSYWTSAAERRPRKVWTTIERLPEGVEVIQQNDDSPFFSFRLPPGKYQLRGNAANFDDVYRELNLQPNMETVELHDLELSVEKRAQHIGRAAPNWHFTAGHGIDPASSLADYRGKWVVIEFWGVWCGPCIQEMDQLFQFSERHALDKDRFEIITLHHDLPDRSGQLEASLPKLLKSWERDEFPFPIAIDTTNKTIDTYGVDSFPTTLIIDPEGRLTSLSGIWELSEVLKGREVKRPELFLRNDVDNTAGPATIKSSYQLDGITSDQYIVLNGHSDMVAAAEFLPDGKQLVTSASDNTIRFWNIETREQTDAISCTPKGQAFSSYGGVPLFVAQDGNLVGGYFYESKEGGLIHKLRLWRADSDFEEFSDLEDTGIHFGKASISPEGHVFAAYAYDSKLNTESLRMYSLPSGLLLQELDINGDRAQDAGKGSALSFSPDGRHLAVAGDKGDSIQIWDVNQGRMLWEEHPADIYGVNSISFFPDGQTFAYATWNEPLEIRETISGKLLKSLRAPGHRPVQVAVSPTGQYLATSGTGSRPGILIWDTAAGEVIGTLVGHPTGSLVADLAWSPDSRRLVSVAGLNLGEPGEVLLWDLAGAGIIDPK